MTHFRRLGIPSLCPQNDVESGPKEEKETVHESIYTSASKHTV